MPQQLSSVASLSVDDDAGPGTFDVGRFSRAAASALGLWSGQVVGASVQSGCAFDFGTCASWNSSLGLGNANGVTCPRAWRLGATGGCHWGDGMYMNRSITHVLRSTDLAALANATPTAMVMSAQLVHVGWRPRACLSALW